MVNKTKIVAYVFMWPSCDANEKCYSFKYAVYPMVWHYFATAYRNCTMINLGKNACENKSNFRCFCLFFPKYDINVGFN